MQSLVTCQKFLNHFALVDRMAIPDQNDGTRHPVENLLKKGDHLCTSQTIPIRTDTQTNSFAFRRDQQSAQQVETLVMIDGGLPYRCLATSRPGPFEWRNKRKTAFIFQNEGRVQLATLFLYWAIPLSSTARWFLHCGVTVVAVVVGCSNPSAASHAKRHWFHNELQIIARSPEQSDPASSSRPHIQRHMPLCLALSPAVSSGWQTIFSDDPVSGLLSSFWAF